MVGVVVGVAVGVGVVVGVAVAVGVGVGVVVVVGVAVAVGVVVAVGVGVVVVVAVGVVVGVSEVIDISSKPGLPNHLKPFSEIFLGMIIHRKPEYETFISLTNLFRKTGSLLATEYHRGSAVGFARNAIIHNLLNESVLKDREFMLFIDEDIAFTVEDVLALHHQMELHPGLGAVGGLYVKHTHPYEPVMNWLHEGGEWFDLGERFTAAHYYIEKEAELVDVDSLGAGFLLIRRQALIDVGRPWFYIDDDSGMTGDTRLCGELKKKGWRSAIHLPTRVGHCAPHMWEPGSFIEQWATIAEQERSKK